MPFGGWRIVNLSPRDFWSGVDLKPGYIATRRVNDLPPNAKPKLAALSNRSRRQTRGVLFQCDEQSRVLEYRIVQRAN